MGGDRNTERKGEREKGRERERERERERQRQREVHASGVDLFLCLLTCCRMVGVASGPAIEGV